MKLKKISIVLIVIVIVMSFGLNVKAVTYTIYGPSYITPAQWNNALVWSPAYPGVNIPSGDTVIIKGYVEVPASVTLNVDGVLIIPESSSLYPGNNSMTARGKVNISTGGVLQNCGYGLVVKDTLNLFGTFQTLPFILSSSYSETYIDSGAIIIQPNANFYINSSQSPQAPDTVHIFGTGVLVVNGTLTNDGMIENNATILGTGSIVTSSSSANGIIFGSGTVAPGLSPGELKVDFDYQLSNSGSLDIEIGGEISGAEYDVLGGTGNKDLGGKLNISLYNGYVPSPGDSFVIVKGTTITDTFTSVTYPSLPSNMKWEISYNPNNAVLKVTAPVGVDRIEIDSQVFIYPNPTNGKIQIDGIKGRNPKYQIHNMVGQRVQSGVVTNGEIILNNVSEGLHLLKLEFGDNENFVTRTIQVGF